jgi:hypothetical protein
MILKQQAHTLILAPMNQLCLENHQVDDRNHTFGQWLAAVDRLHAWMAAPWQLS